MKKPILKRYKVECPQCGSEFDWMNEEHVEVEENGESRPQEIGVNNEPSELPDDGSQQLTCWSSLQLCANGCCEPSSLSSLGCVLDNGSCLQASRKGDQVLDKGERSDPTREVSRIANIGAKLNGILDGVLKLGVAYAGFRALNHPMGAIYGLVALRLAENTGGAGTLPNVSRAAGLLNLGIIGITSAHNIANQEEYHPLLGNNHPLLPFFPQASSSSSQ